MVIDLRVANTLVQKLTSPVIHLDQIRSSIAGSQIYAAIDLTDGYWQISMDKTGSELYSFKTHEGRLMYGCCVWPNYG